MNAKVLLAGTVAVIGLAVLVVAITAEDAEAHATMVVYKSPTCGCCADWVQIVADAGYDPEVHEVDSVAPYKEESGVPAHMVSCHTAVFEGYFIEGHVPLEAIAKLVQERPDFDGIAVPGMPQGSPGMSGEADGPLEVYGVKDGQATLWMTV